MSTEARVSELLLRWEERAGQGPPPTPEELCADCPELAPELRRRIQALRQLDALFGTPDASSAGTPPPAAGAEPALPEEVAAGGRYRPVRFHARGGLGEVFVAHDAQLHRDVALKRLGAARRHDPDSRRRFLREAELTALLEHPGVVPVHGLVEGADGQPGYAMRFVQGETLHDAVRRFHQDDQPPRPDSGARRLALRQLLSRFVAVCNTIAYAHSRGVLHRDLKPANIMLGPYGETLVVDWGLAKPIGQAEEPMPPQAGSGRPGGPEDTAPGQAMGTPAYMSPEQAAGDWERVGPASDVYSLGATLYTLLTGQAPAAGVPGRSGVMVPPRPLNPQVPPALEAICRKALEGRPEARYPSARALADEVERWLADEPVAAYRERLPARLARWGRHHRTWVAGAVVLLASAVVALSTGLLLLGEANRRTEAERAAAVQEKERADEEAAVAIAVRDFLRNDLLREADSHHQADRRFPPDPDVKVRTLLDRAAEQIGERFRDRPRVDASVRMAIGEAYLGVGEYEQGIRHLRAAADLCTTHLGPDHPLTLSTLNNLGLTYNRAGRPTEAVQLLEQVRVRMTQVLGPSHPETLIALTNLAEAFADDGRLVEAIALYEQVRAQRTQLLGADHPHTLETVHGLAGAYRLAGQAAAAIQLSEQVRDQVTPTLGPEHPDTLAILNNLADAYEAAGRTAEAIHLYEQVRDQATQVFGPDHPSTLVTRNSLAGAYLASGRTAEAIDLFEQVRAQRTGKLGPDHPETLTTVNDLALAYQAAGRTAEAIPLLEQVQARLRQRLGPDHPETLTALSNLAVTYRIAGRAAEAIPLLEQVRAQDIKKLGADHPRTLAALNNLAGAYEDVGRATEAIQLFEQVGDLLTRKVGPDHSDTLTALNNLANAYRAVGRATEAVALFEQVRVRELQTHGPDHPDTWTVLHNLALAYLDTGRTAEAIALYEQVRAQRTQHLGPDHPKTLATLGNLALALRRAKQLDRATAVYRDLLAAQTRKGRANDPGRVSTLASLGRCLLETGKPAEAEPVLRECLALREKPQPDHWATFNVKSLLGGSLAGQLHYAEAEALLLAGYESLRQRQERMPANARVRLTEAQQRLVQLYEAWGKPEEAAAWRAKRDQAANPAESPAVK